MKILIASGALVILLAAGGYHLLRGEESNENSNNMLLDAYTQASLDCYRANLDGPIQSMFENQACRLTDQYELELRKRGITPHLTKLTRPQ